MKKISAFPSLLPSTICTLGLMTCVASAQLTSSLLINGSFEQPDVPASASGLGDGWITYGQGYAVNGPSQDFEGWTVTSGEVDVMSGPRTSVSAADGLQFLDLDGRMRGAIAQTFSVVAGKRYNLSFKYGSNSSASMTVQITGASGNALLSKDVSAFGTGPYPGQWLEDGGSFVADSSQATISFNSSMNWGSDNGVKLDDVRIVENSPPSETSDNDNDGVNYFREVADGTNPDDSASFSPLSKGLVAFYSFNNSLSDKSGFANDLTAVTWTGGFTANRFGVANAAIRLGAGTDVLRSSSNVQVAGNDFHTISAWVKIWLLDVLSG